MWFVISTTCNYYYYQKWRICEDIDRLPKIRI